MSVTEQYAAAANCIEPEQPDPPAITEWLERTAPKADPDGMFVRTMREIAAIHQAALIVAIVEAHALVQVVCDPVGTVLETHHVRMDGGDPGDEDPHSHPPCEIYAWIELFACDTKAIHNFSISATVEI